ncbi:unnamed protein product [Rotaria magnacalcarata]|uniref:LTD domain-containing protein n=4 Tax=Rotaria magnacalcarata TaxID=392030 RepID=A0A814NAU3_9BILA|nr:unnamed protein product [Rotaria magnacalcarata]
MATVDDSSLCSVCNKLPGKRFCMGCKKYFCSKDFKEHEKQLSIQFDNEIVRSHDELLDMIQKLEKPDDLSSDLFDQIGQWKKITINKVEKAAESARHELIEMIDKRRTTVTKQLEEITKEIRSYREEETFLEDDIARLRTKLNEIQKVLEQFTRQDTKRAIIATNDRIDWDRIIYIKEGPQIGLSPVGANQSEHSRAQNERDRELADLRAQAEQREAAISALLENKVSLEFEINTYRRLREVEDGHLQRVEGGEGFSGGRNSSAYHYQTRTAVGGSTPRYDTTASYVPNKKMTVQKSARGPIAIDQVDPQGNFIVIENRYSTDKDQHLKGWTLRRKIDSKDDIVYKFPDNFVLKSRSRIRILSRNASKGSINEKEALVAEGVQTWGTGTYMVTRLFDANGDEKALFSQIFQ